MGCAGGILSPVVWWILGRRVEERLEEAGHCLPELRVGDGGDGKSHNAFGGADVDGGTGSWVFWGVEHDRAGFASPCETKAGVDDNPFETGPQEGDGGTDVDRDARRGALVHFFSMAAPVRSNKGGSAPLGESGKSGRTLGASADRVDSPAAVEAMFLRVVLLLRAYHVFAGALTLLFDRRRFVRPRLAWLVFAGLVGESAWLVRRTTARGDYADGPTAAVDVGLVALGLAACSAALPAEEQFNATNWMFPVSLMSGVGAASAFARRRDGLGATLVLGGSYVAASAFRSKRRGIATLLGFGQYVETFIVGDLITRQLRRTATEIVRLRAQAVDGDEDHVPRVCDLA